MRKIGSSPALGLLSFLLVSIAAACSSGESFTRELDMTTWSVVGVDPETGETEFWWSSGIIYGDQRGAKAWRDTAAEFFCGANAKDITGGPRGSYNCTVTVLLRRPKRAVGTWRPALGSSNSRMLGRCTTTLNATWWFANMWMIRSSQQWAH